MPKPVNNSKFATFTADIERYTVRVEHVVAGYSSKIVQRSAQMVGTLRDQNDQVIADFAVDPTSKGDIFTVADLLKAADNVNLDGTS
jgi:hypothetical protein